MNALSHAFVKTLPREIDAFGAEVDEVEGNENLVPAVQEIERYMSADRLVPSYHNVVTVAAIEVCSPLLICFAHLLTRFMNFTVQVKAHSRLVDS